MSTRKIYVRQGEQVEIRVVPEDYELTATEWRESSLRPVSYLAKFYSQAIDITVPQYFTFLMGGKLISKPNASGQPRLAERKTDHE